VPEGILIEKFQPLVVFEIVSKNVPLVKTTEAVTTSPGVTAYVGLLQSGNIGFPLFTALSPYISYHM
jgi:hypothetical protein